MRKKEEIDINKERGEMRKGRWWESVIMLNAEERKKEEINSNKRRAEMRSGR